MTTVSVYEAKTQLSRILRRVEAGEEIVIARDGKPIARLVGVERAKARRYGAGKGAVWIADDFNEPDDEASERPIDPPARPARSAKAARARKRSR
jgi:prevent-host-death family protein